MKRTTRIAFSTLMAVALAGGCAGTNKPPRSAGDEEEEAAAGPGSAQNAKAAQQESAPKPPQIAIQDQKAQQKKAKEEQAKIPPSVKAEFEALVKRWETARTEAKKPGSPQLDCKGFASKFLGIRESLLQAQVHFNAGAALETCGHDKDAESEYQAALQANPAYGPALTNLGELYYKQNNPATARMWFEKAIQADPLHTAPAWTNLAAIQFQQGKQNGDTSIYKTAISNLRRALAIDNDSMAAYALLATIYYTIAENDKSKLQLADLVCKQAKEHDDKFAPIYNTLGLIQLRKKNPTAALREFEQAVALDPKYIEAHLNIGAIGLSTRQYEKAGGAFAAVLKLDPKNIDATIGMGVASRGLKKIEEAEKWYKKVADLEPGNCAIQYNLGVLYQDYKSDPANANLNQAKDYFSKYRSCPRTDTVKVKDAERRIKDIDDTFVAIEQQKKMEADLKAQQEEMEKQQKAMEEQQKQQEAAAKAAAEKGGAKGEKPEKAAPAEKAPPGGDKQE